MTFFLLILAGVVIGTLGTIIGAGGGFLLVPAMALWRPDEAAERISTLSLFIIFCNATSGTYAYTRHRLVHFRSGIIFALAAIPGAIAGTYLAARIGRHLFDTFLGSFLICMSLLIVWRTLHKPPPDHHHEWPGPTPRQLFVGALVSTLVGLLASVLGIGGGLIHVPLFVYAFGYPVHRATATSHFILMITAGLAAAIDIAHGRLTGNWEIAIPLAIGVLGGAQIGAWLSRRLRARWIVFGLCAAIIAVGARLTIHGFRSGPPTPTTAPAPPR